MKYLLAILIAIISLPGWAVYRYVGGDISLLPEYEKAGAQYKDHSGKPIAQLMPWLAQQGMNAMRVRLFVNPKEYTGKDQDPNACQDLDYILPICKQIKDAGMDLMLDFHYTDSWADPVKQWTPKDWANLTDAQLYQKIYDYTKSTLVTLRDNGIVPAFIQPGNEITYGMLWGPEGTKNPLKASPGSDDNWARFGQLLKQAIKACREIAPDAKIILHTERVNKLGIQKNFYRKMADMGIDYDIIGLSYYPYFHGPVSVLEAALNECETDFPTKNIMIVETGYSYKWEVPGTSQPVDYPYSDEGQDQFVKDLVKVCRAHEKVDGLFWWWLEYNAYGTTLQNWYNAPLFDSTTGRACSALTTLCSFADGNPASTPVITADDNGPVQWYNLQGLPVDNPTAPGLYISRRGKRLIAR